MLTKVEYIEDGAVCSVEPEDSDLGYRFSRFAAPERIVLSAEFSLSPDDGMTKERMKDYSERRRAKQPLTYPSAAAPLSARQATMQAHLSNRRTSRE